MYEQLGSHQKNRIKSPKASNASAQPSIKPLAQNVATKTKQITLKNLQPNGALNSMAVAADIIQTKYSAQKPIGGSVSSNLNTAFGGHKANQATVIPQHTTSNVYSISPKNT